jgi:hypothetical protein
MKDLRIKPNVRSRKHDDTIDPTSCPSFATSILYPGWQRNVTLLHDQISPEGMGLNWKPMGKSVEEIIL